MISMSLRKILYYVVFWSVIFIGFYLAFWHPKIKHMEELQMKVNFWHNFIEGKNRDIEVYPKIITLNNLETVKENLRQVFDKIPTKEEIPIILKQIRGYSTQGTDLNITEITNITQERGKGRPEVTQEYPIPKMTYRITAEGRAPDIIRFLYDLENGARLIAIEDVTLNRSSSSEVTPSEVTHRVDMTAILHIFYSSLGVEGAFD